MVVFRTTLVKSTGLVGLAVTLAVPPGGAMEEFSKTMLLPLGWISQNPEFWLRGATSNTGVTLGRPTRLTDELFWMRMYGLTVSILAPGLDALMWMVLLAKMSELEPALITT